MTAKEEFEQLMEALVESVEARESPCAVTSLEFVHSLLRVASQEGYIAGFYDGEDGVRIQVGDQTTYVHHLSVGTFRWLLAAIGRFMSARSPAEGKTRFNPYGDSREITCRIRGSFTHIHIETSNDTRSRPFYFAVLKL